MGKPARALLCLAVLALALPACALEVNEATEAQLDSIKGIGPGLSGKILEVRAHDGAFRDWTDLIRRVRGIGPASARRLSEQGLTVQGQGFGQAPQASGAARASASP
ncbi:helix-hairpin-helix domain-containing protein [Ramlibacter sp. H39-3-26]|uniref:ComEA family DNA-binding protein n=1 Tax=Curvibacter soli TaxID=3031331 RepID=UPI0023DCD763|nr:helix-hairpin-helix domain-containing protein [Ramlibacter sp. H39-3-26]MDF1484189.1 helix-hairpin-helix domain-containing protein [Ramlibacter sp. H39-3-26]